MSAAQSHVQLDRLGELVWYTIREAARPTRSELAQALVNAGLSSSLLPRPISAYDALRRAVRDMGTLPQHESQTGEIVPLLLREGARDPDDLRYLLVEERGNRGQRMLDYENIGLVELAKSTGRIRAAHYAGLASNEAQKVLQDVEARYQFDSGHYDSETVRRITAEALRSANPISVRPSGGVYFVARPYADLIDSVAAFLNAVGGESHLYRITVGDDPDAHGMVADSVETHVSAEAERVVRGLRDLLGSGKANEHATEAALRDLRSLAQLTTQ